MLIVANYHYIREDFSAPFPSIFGVTPAQFEMQLKKLSKLGSFISQQELLEQPEKIEANNYFLITFDDGLKEQYELAKPILDKLGIPYIFFINTSNFTHTEVSLVHKIHLLRSQIAPEELLNQIESKSLDLEEKEAAIKHYNYDSPENAILKYVLNFKYSLKDQNKLINPIFNKVFDETKVANKLYFTKKMLKELSALDALGSHAHTHVPLGRLKCDMLKEELQLTKKFFRNMLGQEVRSISYPYGSYDSCIGIRNLLRQEAFKLGFTMERAGICSLKEDSLLLSRFDCNDLPGGKKDLFKGKDPFKITNSRKWYLYENSTSYQ